MVLRIPWSASALKSMYSRRLFGDPTPEGIAMQLEPAELRVSNRKGALRFFARGLGLSIPARGDTHWREGGIGVQPEDPRS